MLVRSFGNQDMEVNSVMPGVEFYEDIVCQCSMPRGKYKEVGSMFQHLDPELPTCDKCGKVARYLAHQCCFCGGVYVKYFLHPLQPMYYGHCWHCLEHGNIASIALNVPTSGSRVAAFNVRVPPPDFLLAPWIEPLDVSDSLAEMERLLGEI